MLSCFRFFCVLFVSLALTTAAVTAESGRVSPHSIKGSTDTYNYIIKLPADYDSCGLYPCILDLHDAGQRGNYPDMLKYYGMWHYLQFLNPFPFIVLFPQCPDEEIWQPDKVLAFLDYAVAKYPIDTDRIYLCGIGMGGGGTWSTAVSAPHRFAAIAPICGESRVLKDLCKISHVPVWVFHGMKDRVVPFRISLQRVKALKACGGNPEMTAYPAAAHNIQATYALQGLYNWFLNYPDPYIGNPVIFTMHHNNGMICHARPVVFHMDGKLDEWQGAEILHLDQDKKGGGMMPAAEDFSGSAMIGWHPADAEHLYVALTITDDRYVDTFNSPHAYKNDDSIDICFDWENNGSTITWHLDANGRDGYCWAAARNLRWMMKSHGNQRIYEICIDPDNMYPPVSLDFSKTRITMECGMQIGFSIQYTDTDEKPAEHIIGWTPGHASDNANTGIVIIDPEPLPRTSQ